MANINAFISTKNLFANYLQWKEPLSYEEWLNSPQESKSAILFVQFFDNICQAWHTVNAFDFADPDEGVETICRYLEKNVPVIEKSEGKRFTAPYIYRVAYNCLYCICHDRKCDKDRWENEIPATVQYDGEELNLYDTVPDAAGSADMKYESEDFIRRFWEAIEDAGQPAEKVVDYLLSGNRSDLNAVSKSSPRYEFDPLRDVRVKLSEVDGLVEQLRSAMITLKLEFKSDDIESIEIDLPYAVDYFKWLSDKCTNDKLQAAATAVQSKLVELTAKSEFEDYDNFYAKVATELALSEDADRIMQFAQYA